MGLKIPGMYLHAGTQLESLQDFLDLWGPSWNFGEFQEASRTCRDLGELQEPLGTSWEPSGTFGEPLGNPRGPPGTFGEPSGTFGDLRGTFEEPAGNPPVAGIVPKISISSPTQRQKLSIGEIYII